MQDKTNAVIVFERGSDRNKDRKENKYIEKMMMMIWFRGPQPSAPFKDHKSRFANDSFASKEDDGRRRGGCQSLARPSPLVLDRIIIIFARLVASVGGGCAPPPPARRNFHR